MIGMMRGRWWQRARVSPSVVVYAQLSKLDVLGRFHALHCLEMYGVEKWLFHWVSPSVVVYAQLSKFDGVLGRFHALHCLEMYEGGKMVLPL
ncbi:unnamed protein product [Camellia sinensis]